MRPVAGGHPVFLSNYESFLLNLTVNSEKNDHINKIITLKKKNSISEV